MLIEFIYVGRLDAFSFRNPFHVSIYDQPFQYSNRAIWCLQNIEEKKKRWPKFTRYNGDMKTNLYIIIVQGSKMLNKRFYCYND